MRALSLNCSNRTSKRLMATLELIGQHFTNPMTVLWTDCISRRGTEISTTIGKYAKSHIKSRTTSVGKGTLSNSTIKNARTHRTPLWKHLNSSRSSRKIVFLVTVQGPLLFQKLQILVNAWKESLLSILDKDQTLKGSIYPIHLTSRPTWPKFREQKSRFLLKVKSPATTSWSKKEEIVWK